MLSNTMCGHGIAGSWCTGDMQLAAAFLSKFSYELLTKLLLCCAERSRALASLETVSARPGLTPEDVLASKKHTDAVLASSSEKV